MKEVAAARKEYTKQLFSIMAPVIYEKLCETYNKANKSKSERPVLIKFQLGLREYKEWSSLKVKSELDKMTQRAPYFDDLITAIFITSVRIMSAIQIGNANKKISLEPPNAEAFVHDAYIRTARTVYNKPTLFDQNRYPRLEDNQTEVMEVIRESIEDTIRAFLPVKSILESYLVPGEDGTSLASEEPLGNGGSANPEPLEHPTELVAQAEEIQPTPPLDVEGASEDEAVDEELDSVPEPPSSPASGGGADERPTVKHVRLREPPAETKETETKPKEEESKKEDPDEPFFSDASDDES